MSVPDEKLVELLGQAEQIMIFTGAGVSTGSGIPDFRGPKGIWKTKQPVMYQDFMSSEPARVEYWAQKAEFHAVFAQAEPNATHAACARLHQAGKLHMLVTQNIDGLHEKAGVPREKLVELHGTNRHVECQTCGQEADLQESFAYFEEHQACPRCPCGGFLKSATISFGQSLRQEDLERAAEAAMTCDLTIALGSTMSVYPAAEFPLVAARRSVPYVLINLGVTEHDDLPVVTLRLEGDVSELFPPAVDAALT
jgi:NAD-dependent deacetylase